MIHNRFLTLLILLLYFHLANIERTLIIVYRLVIPLIKINAAPRYLYLALLSTLTSESSLSVSSLISTNFFNSES